MAIMGTKLTLLLGLLVAALVMAAAQPPEDKKNQGAVTIYNPAGLLMDIMNDDKNVRVTTETATLALTQAMQDLQILIVGGEQSVIVSVQDGDVFVVIPDPCDASNVQAFKILEAGEEPRASVAVEKPARSQVLPAGDIPNPTVRP